jgi:hypothetical protein
MQPRRHRLGDVVDDYCPRERRLSNHVIVAIVDDTIKQTRCSTCDFEHPYKEGKLPARRLKKDSPPALYKQVLDNVTEGAPASELRRGILRPNGTTATAEGNEAPAQSEPERTRVPDVAAAGAARADETPSAPAPEPPPVAAGDAADEGPVHRTLIRATLPRQEGESPARPLPTFTIREAATVPKFRRFRPKRGGGGRPFGDGFGNQGGGFKNPPFGAHAGRGQGHGQKPGGPNRGNQQPRAAGAHGGRRNNARRGNKGPR